MAIKKLASGFGTGAAGRRVLVVEDDDTVRRFASEALGELGYEVVEAVTGDQALEAIARTVEGIDAVFSDIVMPGRTSGLALVRAILELRPAFPIVLTTGHSEEAYDLGDLPQTVRLLRKPYHVKELAAALQAVIAVGATVD